MEEVMEEKVPPEVASEKIPQHLCMCQALESVLLSGAWAIWSNQEGWQEVTSPLTANFL